MLFTRIIFHHNHAYYLSCLFFSIQLSGRDMFTFNPDMATDDATEEGEAAFDMKTREDQEEVRYLS